MDAVDAEWLGALLQMNKIARAANAGHDRRLLDGLAEALHAIGQR